MPIIHHNGHFAMNLRRISRSRAKGAAGLVKLDRGISGEVKFPINSNAVKKIKKFSFPDYY